MLYQALSGQALSKMPAGSLIEMLDELDNIAQGVRMGEIEGTVQSDASASVLELLALPSPIVLAASRAFWDERAAEARSLSISGPGSFILMNGRVS